MTSLYDKGGEIEWKIKYQESVGILKVGNFRQDHKARVLRQNHLRQIGDMAMRSGYLIDHVLLTAIIMLFYSLSI
jgi:hypothetical protein